MIRQLSSNAIENKNTNGGNVKHGENNRNCLNNKEQIQCINQYNSVITKLISKIHSFQEEIFDICNDSTISLSQKISSISNYCEHFSSIDSNEKTKVKTEKEGLQQPPFQKEGNLIHNYSDDIKPIQITNIRDCRDDLLENEMSKNLIDIYRLHALNIKHIGYHTNEESDLNSEQQCTLILNDKWYVGSLKNQSDQISSSDNSYALVVKSMNQERADMRVQSINLASLDNQIKLSDIVAARIRLNGQFEKGVVAEIPSHLNSSRYLIFFDMFRSRYCPLDDVYKPLDATKENFSSNNRIFDNFLVSYFDNHNGSMQTSTFKSDDVIEVLVSDMINFESAKILRIDCSLMLIKYVNGTQREWLYKGSPRIRDFYKLYDFIKNEINMNSNSDDDDEDDDDDDKDTGHDADKKYSIKQEPTIINYSNTPLAAIGSFHQRRQQLASPPPRQPNNTCYIPNRKAVEPFLIESASPTFKRPVPPTFCYNIAESQIPPKIPNINNNNNNFDSHNLNDVVNVHMRRSEQIRLSVLNSAQFD